MGRLAARTPSGRPRSRRTAVPNTSPPNGTSAVSCGGYQFYTFRAARRKARMAKPGVGVGCRPTALRDSRPAVLSRFLAAASLTAVALLVALGAGRSLGADAARRAPRR